jgi:rhamnose transport system ATP-binding protein
MAQPLLELRGVNKTFPGVRALDNVTFDVRPGEVHALLGENGAGKSTLIKIISGVYRPDGGEYLVDGQPANFNSPGQAQSKGISAIYQELGVYAELTVTENIFMGHMPRNRYGALNWRAARRDAWAILDSLDATDLHVDKKVGSLSIGNRQRVEIAKALSQNARVLILDEPTAALTAHDVERLFNIVRKLRERGVALIYISHRLEEVFQLADRVTVLRDGQHVDTKLVAETNEADLVRMMVGRTLDNLYPKSEARIGNTVLRARDIVHLPMTRGISLELRQGEIVGMAGLIGSGRSEFAQVLFGITPATSGSIEVDGKSVIVRNPADAMSLGIAYVPEDRQRQGLIIPMSVRENTSLALLRLLVKGPFVDLQAEQRLATDSVTQLNIKTPSVRQLVRNLSGGNQQKIVIAKWLATKPRILIMDEPTRGIDVGAKFEIHRLMSTLAAQGLAILMISSDLPEVLGMSDRVVTVRDGQIVAEFTRAEATQENVVTAMMGAVEKEMVI